MTTNHAVDEEAAAPSATMFRPVVCRMLRGRSWSTVSRQLQAEREAVEGAPPSALLPVSSSRRWQLLTWRGREAALEAKAGTAGGAAGEREAGHSGPTRELWLEEGLAQETRTDRPCQCLVMRRHSGCCHHCPC